MDSLPAATANAFRDDLRAVAETRRESVVKSTRDYEDTAWRRWQRFCDAHQVNSTLVRVQGAAFYLQVFAYRLRHGHYTKDPVRVGTVAHHLSAISKGIQRLVDPKDLNPAISPGSYEHGARELLRTFAREDPPKDRAWPVTTAILDQLLREPPPRGTSPNKWRATQQLCVIGFFFLLRPGEYSKTKAEPGQTQTKPFRSKDMLFGTEHSSASETAPTLIADCNDPKIARAGLNFEDQKNGKKDDKISHTKSGHPTLCPVRALQQRKTELRTCMENTPIYMFHHEQHNRLEAISASFLTKALRHAAAQCQHITGIPADKISARSLRAGGATALLCAKIDKDIIKLLGRWRSDAVDEYLRTNVICTSHDTFSTLMVTSGNYRFLSPAADLDILPDLLPEEGPDTETTDAYFQAVLT